MLRLEKKKREKKEEEENERGDNVGLALVFLNLFCNLSSIKILVKIGKSFFWANELEWLK